MYTIPKHLQDFAVKLNQYGAMHTPCLCIIDFEGKKPLLIEAQDITQQNIHIHFPTYCTPKINSKEKNHQPLHPQPISLSDYKKGYDTVMRNIQYGNSFLTNYTCSTQLNKALSLQDIFEQAQSKYKILFKDQWLCFSPETFIAIKDGYIYSRPMKGTIDANIENAKEIILNDHKEIAEHYTIVDLIRNDLSIIASQVQVKEFRYIEEIRSNEKKLLQVSSLIQGKLPANYLHHLGDIVCSLLPAGSISGAPKKKTIDIILEAECHSRGYYTGIAAWFDGYRLDSCVLIRFIEKTEQGYVYKSGGGITCNSEMEKEYKEIIDKVYVPIF